jgi:hypothetical protein
VNTNTTRTLVDAALRLVDELPKGTPPEKVLKHWLDSARRDGVWRIAFRSNAIEWSGMGPGPDEEKNGDPCTEHRRALLVVRAGRQ